MYNYNNPRIPNVQFDNNDRIFPFFFPFLGGALIGGAAVAATRPRPVFVQPAPYPYYQPYGYGYRPYY